MGWYALFVRRDKEPEVIAGVQQALGRLVGDHEVIPWTKGFVLCRVEMSEAVKHAIRTVRFCKGFVGGTNPIEITQAEVEAGPAAKPPLPMSFRFGRTGKE